jgi:tRNA-2-methylthio-N6-dimethylallyladenosine synthase
VAEFLRVAARLRRAIPGMALSTDVIVGFPGESEADFELTRRHLLEVRYDSAFLFKYSARPDTRAHGMPETVSEEEKGERLAALIETQQQVSAQINDGWIGRETEVLVESQARKNAQQLYGKNPQFKTVVFADDGSAPGELRRVRVIGATPVTLLARAVAPAALPVA